MLHLCMGRGEYNNRAYWIIIIVLMSSVDGCVSLLPSSSTCDFNLFDNTQSGTDSQSSQI